MRILILLSLVTVAGCSLVTGDGSSVFEVSFLLPLEAADGLDVRTTLDVDGEVRTLLRADFEPVGERQFDAAPLRIPATGTGELSCTVGRGDVRSEGAVTFDVEDGYLYRVSCAVQTALPGCFGCRGTESFPLDPALGFSGDARLYISWGGDPEDDPVNY